MIHQLLDEQVRLVCQLELYTQSVLMLSDEGFLTADSGQWSSLAREVRTKAFSRLCQHIAPGLLHHWDWETELIDKALYVSADLPKTIEIIGLRRANVIYLSKSSISSQDLSLRPMLITWLLFRELGYKLDLHDLSLGGLNLDNMVNTARLAKGLAVFRNSYYLQNHQLYIRLLWDYSQKLLLPDSEKPELTEVILQTGDEDSPPLIFDWFRNQIQLDKVNPEFYGDLITLASDFNYLADVSKIKDRELAAMLSLSYLHKEK